MRLLLKTKWFFALQLLLSDHLVLIMALRRSMTTANLADQEIAKKHRAGGPYIKIPVRDRHIWPEEVPPRISSAARELWRACQEEGLFQEPMDPDTLHIDSIVQLGNPRPRLSLEFKFKAPPRQYQGAPTEVQLLKDEYTMAEEKAQIQQQEAQQPEQGTSSASASGPAAASDCVHISSKEGDYYKHKNKSQSLKALLFCPDISLSKGKFPPEGDHHHDHHPWGAHVM